MIDHLLGRPSASWRRTQVVLVLLFWGWRLRSGNPRGPTGLKRLNDKCTKFTPWQLAVALLTWLYGVRHWDILFGLAAPEPLARLYSRGFYRATWINTALDAGFATAAAIPFKWLRDLLSVVFSGYYLIYANEADEKLRKFRAIPTVEILRVTWEKTTNPLIQLFTRNDRPPIPIRRKYTFPRPSGSKYTKPITCWLYFSRPDLDLVRSKNLIIDVPGGGFIAMSPLHHEERLIRWTMKTGIPILSIDYCKAPEYPFPYAIHECMDVYRTIQESKGRVIGMGRDEVDIVVTGDSAGANLSAAMITSMLEAPPDSPFHGIPMPVGILWMYAALDFNFTSWMSPENLRILRRDKSAANLPEGILEAKDHLKHKSPLSVVDDRSKSDDEDGRRRHRRHRSNFTQSFAHLPSMMSNWKRALTPRVERRLSDVELKVEAEDEEHSSKGSDADDEDVEGDASPSPPSMNREKSLGERVLFHEEDPLEQAPSTDNADEDGEASDAKQQAAGVSHSKSRAAKKPFGTRLTMTSRTGFFNDRIISPSMMRCMAICYIGPRNAPDLTKDYHISPIFTPAKLLAQYPPVYLVCGEKDPFVDDTVIIAGKLREAKQGRKMQALMKLSKQNEAEWLGAVSHPDPIVDETEADWVQMRIFEGWSHGFAQMLALLPEVNTALDLTADFILSAFHKHEEKLRVKQARLGVSSERTPPVSRSKPGVLSATRGTSEEDALTFSPRSKGRRNSAARAVSCSPSLYTAKVARTLGSISESSPSSNRAAPPVLRLPPEEEVPDRSRLFASLGSRTSAIPGSAMSVTPMVEFNAASAGAIVTPPVVPMAASATLPVRREGTILSDPHDLLNRRREEAGYGLPPMKTPEDHFRPLGEPVSPVSVNKRLSMERGRKGAAEEGLKGQYVGEKDLLERRRVDAAYGIRHSSDDEGGGNEGVVAGSVELE